MLEHVTTGAGVSQFPGSFRFHVILSVIRLIYIFVLSTIQESRERTVRMKQEPFS